MDSCLGEAATRACGMAVVSRLSPATMVTVSWESRVRKHRRAQTKGRDMGKLRDKIQKRSDAARWNDKDLKAGDFIEGVVYDIADVQGDYDVRQYLIEVNEGRQHGETIDADTYMLSVSKDTTLGNRVNA